MIIVKLMGGMGNQMFQYAFGRSLSLKKGVPLKLDYVSKLEQLTESWPEIVARMTNLDQSQIQNLLELHHINKRPLVESARLSDSSIKKMCASEMFRSDWTCFGYELPAICG